MLLCLCRYVRQEDDLWWGDGAAAPTASVCLPPVAVRRHTHSGTCCLERLRQFAHDSCPLSHAGLQ